ncbi:MAG: histidine kinase [Herpetosiphon sp.]
MISGSVPAHRSPIMGADRIYAGIRWALLIIIFGLSTATKDGGLLWPLASVGAFGVTLYGYAVFVAIATLAVLLRQMNGLVAWLYVGDFAAIALLAYTSHTFSPVYQTLFLLPLVAITFRFQMRAILFFALLAISIEIGLLYHTGLFTIEEFISRSLSLIALPMLVSFLSHQWSADHRASLHSAEQRRSEALQEAEQYRDRMRSLYEVAYTLSTTAKASAVLDRTLKEMTKVLPYHAAAFVMPTESPNEICVVAGNGLQPQEHGSRWMVGKGLMDSILRGGDGGVLPVEARRNDLLQLPSIAACPAVLAIPLRARFRTYGMALVGLTDGHPTNEQMEMATALINYGLVALQNAQLVEELRGERNTVLEREGETRRRLNRDIHDGPAQALAAITMNLDFLQRQLQHEPENVPEELQKLKAMASRANHDIRTLLFELRPLVLETQGLVTTIQQYIERFKDNPTEITVDGDEEAVQRLSKQVQGAMFNIVQESMNNALKHSQAKHLWVRLRLEGDHVDLIIQDDGRGFDLQQVQAKYDQRGSFGLLSIHERAKLLGGTANLLSIPGAGTTVKIQVPCEEEAIELETA